jgi:hypothetical protein
VELQAVAHFRRVHYDLRGRTGDYHRVA